MSYIPKAGEIIRMRSWCGIVLDVYKNEAGKTVLRVQTVRNIFRRLGPEFIEVDLAPEHITPATIEELHREIDRYQETLETTLKEFMSHADVTAMPLEEPGSQS